SAQGIGENSSLVLNGGTFRYTGASYNGSSNFAPAISVGASGGTLDITRGFVFDGGSFSGSGPLTIINSNSVASAWLLYTGASPSFTGNITIGNGIGTQ